SLTQRLQLARELIHRYDKDKSGKLTREEIGLEEELFNLLDRNGDRVLDATELMRYVVVAPDVDVTVHLGRRGPQPLGVTITPGKRANLVKSLRQSGGGVTLAMPSAQIDVRGSETVTQAALLARRNIEQVFRRLDTANKGVLDMKALDKNPRLA